jgi:hypothetical protein
VLKRVLGAEHPHTLVQSTRAKSLALSLSGQGKYADSDAERIQREVHGVLKCVRGAEHPHTLTSADNLPVTMSLAY